MCLQRKFAAFFITPLCRSNLYSDKGRPALVQLWPPLSRRLVDSDAFARASALAALKAASRVDAPFFTKKVMEQVWPVLSARACGGDAGVSHTMNLLFVWRLMLTFCAEALAGVADIVRSFPQSTVLPDFACALALWCESRYCSAPVWCIYSHNSVVTVHPWQLSAVQGRCGGRKPSAAALQRARRFRPPLQQLCAPLQPVGTRDSGRGSSTGSPSLRCSNPRMQQDCLASKLHFYCRLDDVGL